VPKVIRQYEVLGDLSAVAGVGNPVRFDFESVTIFPDGRVAVSFLDSTTTMHHPVYGTEGFAPAIAVELSTKLGRSVPPPEPEVDPVLGEPYASFTFDRAPRAGRPAASPRGPDPRRAPRPDRTTPPPRATGSRVPAST
jgi:hypothetical protein